MSVGYKRVVIDVRTFNDFSEEFERKLRDEIEFKEKGSAVMCFDVKDVTDEYKDNMVEEYCSFCEHDVLISANGISKCPRCGNNILPCSMCISCVNDCPFTEGYEMLSTFPEDDEKKYSTWFYVPKDWLSKNIGIKYETIEEFKDSYTWDETYFLMQKAQKDGVYLKV